MLIYMRMKNKLKKVISLVSFLFIINVQAETTVFIEDLHFERNQKEKLVSINMTNDTEFTAFQMDVYLPSGLEFKSNNNGYFIENDRIENSKHNLMCAKQDEGFYRILCYSKSNTNIKGNIGVLFYVTIVANNTFEGKGELIIKDIVLTKDVEVYNLRYNYIPTVYSSCSISTGFSEGKLKLDGSYDVWLESPDGDSDIDFNKMYIIFELNGKEIQRTEVKDSLSENSYYGSVNQTLKFEKGDVLSLYALVEDIDGYTIKREITEYSLSDDEFVEELYSSEGGEVITKNGKVLYQQ